MLAAAGVVGSVAAVERAVLLSPGLVLLGGAGGSISFVCVKFFWPAEGGAIDLPRGLSLAFAIFGIALVDMTEDGRGRSFPLPLECPTIGSPSTCSFESELSVSERERWKPMLVLGRDGSFSRSSAWFN